MGYMHYTLPGGREAGYGVDAECDKPECLQSIDRGMGYLCGDSPNGRRKDNEWGCGAYFCEPHKYAHSCPNPECGAYSFDGDLYCGQPLSHMPPHCAEDGETFVKTEEDDE